MLATLLIVFREAIEAGLIVGIVLAATKGVPRRGLWVSYGIIGASRALASLQPPPARSPPCSRARARNSSMRASCFSLWEC